MLADGRLDVLAACQTHSSDDGKWKLHIVSPSVDSSGLQESYIVVIKTIEEIRDAEIEATDVKFLRPGLPPAGEILEFYGLNPSPVGTRSRGMMLVDEPFDFFYAYPPVGKTTA